ncbi:MAG: NAD(P)-dependent oxidoreductase [bacterium]|nr:NAD(P)-dependent oxidoreductase [bacterium]
MTDSAMKTAIVTGPTSLVGYWLIKELIDNNVIVYALCRKNSKRRKNLDIFDKLKIIELDIEEIDKLPLLVDNIDVFYHLAWEGERNDYAAQSKNITNSIKAMETAKKVGAYNFIVTGSQAEYGSQNFIATEESTPKPDTAYGICKLSTFNILCVLAEKININLIWARLFSVYGLYDHPNKLIPYILNCFKKNISPELTKAEQYWDFLHATDAAKALYSISKIKSVNIYNIAYGSGKPLKEYIVEARNLCNPNVTLKFGTVPENIKKAVSLRADINKIKKDTQWEPKISFAEGIKTMYNEKINF